MRRTYSQESEDSESEESKNPESEESEESKDSKESNQEESIAEDDNKEYYKRLPPLCETNHQDSDFESEEQEEE